MTMITCPDCGKEMSDAAPACPNCGKPNAKAQPKRSVGFLLGLGIFFVPLIFAWFTLRKGHSVTAKIVSFVWLAVTLLFFSSINNADIPKTVATPASVEPAKPAVSASTSKAVTDSVLETPIKQLLADYRNNEVAADNKYKSKLVQTTGLVDDIKKDIMNNLYVTIGTGRDFEIPQVQAFFDDSMNNQLAALNKGQKITVVCRIEGLMMNVLGRKCIIK